MTAVVTTCCLLLNYKLHVARNKTNLHVGCTLIRQNLSSRSRCLTKMVRESFFFFHFCFLLCGVPLACFLSPIPVVSSLTGTDTGTFMLTYRAACLPISHVVVPKPGVQTPPLPPSRVFLLCLSKRSLTMLSTLPVLHSRTPHMGPEWERLLIFSFRDPLCDP